MTDIKKNRIRIGINGFGRIGRLVFRTLLEKQLQQNDNKSFEVVVINEAVGDAAMAAYLAQYDSVHGKWHNHQVKSLQHDQITVTNQDNSQHTIQFSNVDNIEQAAFACCDLVLECTGEFKTKKTLEPYFNMVKRVIVACPVKEEGVLNVVMGINDHLLTAEHRICTAASCTTNCIAPVVKVIQEKLGIQHGCITTVHDLTNTQSIVDAPNPKKSDPRRARSALMNLAPTSTGSATAIGEIFPELKGKLNGLAIRVPLCNASLTDLVFQVNQPTTKEEVNQMLKEASDNELKGILGYETLPLVSCDYINDPRSGIIDALSTMVINETMVKIYCWYDNEYGYALRMAELSQLVVTQMLEK